MRGVPAGGAGMGASWAVCRRAKRPAWLPINEEPDVEPDAPQNGPKGRQPAVRAWKHWKHLIERKWRLAMLRKMWNIVGTYLQVVSERRNSLR